MHRFRSTLWLTRLILAWFAISVGAAIAAPLVHPQAMDIVCTASGGIKLVAVGASADDRAAPPHQHQLECPLCMPVYTPPSASHFDFCPPRPLAHALLPYVAAHLAALAGAPLPARGPPPSSLTFA
ncbi:MAG: hypothetical protein RSD57_01820 [Comamonas sp.]